MRLSIDNYDYSSVKSAAEQTLLAFFQGVKEVKIDNVTHTYFLIENIDGMYVEISLCDEEGFMISEDKHSSYITDMTADKMTAVMMSMLSDYHLWLYTDVLKHQPDSMMTIEEIGGQNDTIK